AAPGAAGTGTGTGAAAKAAGAAGAAASTTPEDTSKQATRNYEIDRTVSYTRQPAGSIKRLTVAVLVDNVRQAGKDGKLTDRPLTQAEIDNITRLVKDAVGFNAARGDSVNVVNEAFLQQTEVLTPAVVPLWQRPWVQNVTRLVLGALVLIALALGVLRPLIKNLASHAVASSPALLVQADTDADGAGGAATGRPGQPLAYEQQIVQARNLVTQDPKRVAQVVKTWVAEQ
ncbi:MAG: flagellar M-ring protein FliF C-terminal domain-containing protein, partial [Steroidobacteraceae bacterium]